MDRKSLGIHLINLLSYPQKFTLIGFLFAIPLTFVMYLLICAINSLIYFTIKNFYGNQYLHPLRLLREYIPKLQLLNYQSLNPNLSNSESRANLEAKIDANFQSLANTDPQVGNILMSRENFNKFNQNWQNLKLSRSEWSLETYDFVDQRLAADINRLSARVGDTSHLIFDPDLDIYYLINATLGQVVGAFNKIVDALIGKNQEITVLNDRLKDENMRIISELDLTRKIQHMLPPKNRKIKEIIGLDIAGFMEAAEEVGGDYYDVLQHQSRVKIGMDDVTGHGWESSVLMIMVQTAARTWLADNEAEPIKILSAINSVIYDRVQRLKFGKNASLALLDYQQGMLKLTGQHEEMIVVRCNGCVERFDTIDLGFQLGLDAEIAEFFVETSVQLYSGDVVVLYTDGITEAENMDKLLYGLDRLIEVIEINWQRSAAEIRNAVIKDVRSHIGKQKVYDDITLLVLKQK
jgi:serine phosphatase RsbU (regulator of sigma subunit)